MVFERASVYNIIDKLTSVMGGDHLLHDIFTDHFVVT